MITAYEEILGFKPEILRYVVCSLDTGKLWYRGELVFEKGRFVGEWERLNSRGLISCVPDEQEPRAWKRRVEELYLRYQQCLPWHRTFLNFKTVSKKDVDPLSAVGDFDYCRCALELYLLFHAAQKDLLWDDRYHFFEKITDGCIVYRRWLL